MEGDSGDGETCPQLELRLGPPGGGGRDEHRAPARHDPAQTVLPSFGYFHAQQAPNQYSLGCYPLSAGPQPSQHQRVPTMEPERAAMELNDSKGKAFSANTALPSGGSQKRSAPAPVVGWPPIRSFRKNLASTSSNHAKQPQPAPAPEPRTLDKAAGEKPVAPDNSGKAKGLFVKINMDGVPIGRKVDLRAYGSYEKLSAAVDELFRGLLAAQRDSSAGGIQGKEEEEKPITGLLDGRGEYTLVYEDYEGDQMLVGDVPWQMFVSTVKRLRVLKSSELSVLSIGCRKQEKTSGD